ncbi:MAG: ribonuclease HII [Candidatus Aenigmatarchaeota archaeon]
MTKAEISLIDIRLTVRGSVVGPLVIAGAIIEERNLKKLAPLGLKDSKLLTPKKRELMYAELKKLLKGYNIVKISARNIDTLRQKKNLNIIEAEAMARIIKEASADKAIVDAPQVSTEKFRNILLNLARNHTEIIAENKADERYPIVSAASIIAKVERDAEIGKIKKKVKFDLGVGYPHDERTIAFVKAAIDNPDFSHYVRHSWVTVEMLKGKKKQKKLEEF